MGKKRQTIQDIQEALLSSTQYIREGAEPQTAPPEEETSLAAAGCAPIPIDPRILRKFRILAMYQNTTPEHLIELALEDFLALRSRQLEAAILKLTSE